MAVNLNKISSMGKAFYLAYDQGLEHGPEMELNEENVNPLFIIDIAKRGKFNGVIFQKGIAEKYNKEVKKSGVPLIVKLNGKTKLVGGEPRSLQLCTVKEAIQLGASAVGYTIYIGSEHEAQMLQEFENIEREAHRKNIPVIAWVYPRGKNVKNPLSRESIAYAARVGLEIGADIVKLHWNGNISDLKWALESAGRCKVVIAGGMKIGEKELLKNVRAVKESGAFGIAIGRNIWKAKKPVKLALKIRKILFVGKNN